LRRAEVSVWLGSRLITDGRDLSGVLSALDRYRKIIATPS
jgi:hypothetical protein